ncbi:unnamed protein product [Ilex paraguariensis]|uniref:Uncharacterized protein n=1 Tax=Ilex paraguariensis TaxID=185542 RepID=A0ABC8S9T6_9AQUA
MKKSYITYLNKKRASKKPKDHLLAKESFLNAIPPASLSLDGNSNMLAMKEIKVETLATDLQNQLSINDSGTVDGSQYAAASESGCNLEELKIAYKTSQIPNA